MHIEDCDIVVMPVVHVRMPWIIDVARRFVQELSERGHNVILHDEDVRIGYKLRDMRMSKARHAVVIAAPHDDDHERIFWIKRKDGVNIQEGEREPVTWLDALNEMIHS